MIGTYTKSDVDDNGTWHVEAKLTPQMERDLRAMGLLAPIAGIVAKHNPATFTAWKPTATEKEPPF